jgi:hypothetical protein
MDRPGSVDALSLALAENFYEELRTRRPGDTHFRCQCCGQIEFYEGRPPALLVTAVPRSPSEGGSVAVRGFCAGCIAAHRHDVAEMTAGTMAGLV